MRSLNENFGNYTLVRQIAVGGMAEVFLGRHSGPAGFEKEIVIKRIRPHLTEQPNFVEMFLGEAKLAAQLSHPNIVQIYDLGKIDDTYFIAMEYVDGRDMSAVIPKCRANNIQLPVEYAMRICSSVCEGLYYAHTKSDDYGSPLYIVHRDISPENIRIAWSGTVKLLDFGIAKASKRANETRGGEIKGKISYMSPEQIVGKDVDHRSDIFSLGIVLYESLTGFKLFTGETDLATMQNILDGKIYPPSYYREHVPKEAEAIVMKALTKDRRKRYQSVSDMQLDIDSFLASGEFTPSSIHLANFLKQLFKGELEEEQERRIRKTPVPATSAPALPAENEVTPSDFEIDETDKAQLRPQGSMAGLDDERQGTNSDDEFELASAWIEQEETASSPMQSEITVALSENELTQVRSCARARGKDCAEFIRDLVQHYLAFNR